MYEYFKEEEFDSPDLPGSGSRMQPDLLHKLTAARVAAGIPFKINSGYRTIPHNAKVGGKANSSHTQGWAVDISATSSQQRFIILEALLLAGFTRIGIAKTFIHADCDPNKASKVAWLY